MFTQTLGILAGITSLLSFVFYYVSIFKGKTRPNRATWFILSIAATLIVISYYDLGARDTLWVPISFAVGQFITFLFSIKYGEGGWTNFDRVCLSISIISVIIWYFSGSALVTLIFNIFIDFLGMLPTIRKSYLRPRGEALVPWAITFLSSILNLMAISSLRFDIAFYPIYMFFINGLVVCILYFRPKQKRL